MRYGEKAAVIPEPHKKPNCPDGWYELVSGGFVCGKYATLDLDHPRFKLAKPPDLDGPLPYIYGVNVANGTPLYNSVPSRARAHEARAVARRARKQAKVVADDDNPYAAPDAGTSGMLASDRHRRERGHRRAPSPDAGAECRGGRSIARRRTAADHARRPPGRAGGPIARRMVKGFYLSLDHQFDAAGTIVVEDRRQHVGAGGPHPRPASQSPSSTASGSGKDDGTFATKDVAARRIDKLPVGFVLHLTKRWLLDADHKQLSLAPGSTR